MSVDPAVLANIRRLNTPGEPDALQEVIELFFEDTPLHLGRIRSALRTKDGTLLEDAAHSLKGSAGGLGAGLMAELCSNVIREARRQDFAAAEAWVQQLEVEFGRVKEILERERGRG